MAVLLSAQDGLAEAEASRQTRQHVPAQVQMYFFIQEYLHRWAGGQHTAAEQVLKDMCFVSDKMQKECPSGHALAAVLSDTGTWSCNVCEQGYQEGTTFLSCSTCEYDECQ
ncbi:unnamed protein product, partial [Polarella glacialis]